MPHTSTGTVRVIITTVANQHNTVVFVPDHDHSAQNGESKHVVFFDENEGRAIHRVRALDGNGGIQLKLPDGNQTLLSAALSAATTGTKVKIGVQDIQDPDNPRNAQYSRNASITKITLPAE